MDWGAIEIKRQSITVQAYFRYYRQSKPVRVKIGAYGQAGFTLAEIRTKAGELAKLRQEIAPTDLKLHLERRHIEKGSFGELMDAYILDMERRKRLTVKAIKRYLKLTLKQLPHNWRRQPQKT